VSPSVGLVRRSGAPSALPVLASGFLVQLPVVFSAWPEFPPSAPPSASPSVILALLQQQSELIAHGCAELVAE
jgi:hypothetical protein